MAHTQIRVKYQLKWIITTDVCPGCNIIWNPLGHCMLPRKHKQLQELLTLVALHLRSYRLAFHDSCQTWLYEMDISNSDILIIRSFHVWQLWYGGDMYSTCIFLSGFFFNYQMHLHVSQCRFITLVIEIMYPHFVISKLRKISTVGTRGVFTTSNITARFWRPKSWITNSGTNLHRKTGWKLTLCSGSDCARLPDNGPALG